jgi:hypothetical protein
VHAWQIPFVSSPTEPKDCAERLRIYDSLLSHEKTGTISSYIQPHGSMRRTPAEMMRKLACLPQDLPKQIVSKLVENVDDMPE